MSVEQEVALAPRMHEALEELKELLPGVSITLPSSHRMEHADA
jgi:hypothetical protein